MAAAAAPRRDAFGVRGAFSCIAPQLVTFRLSIFSTGTRLPTVTGSRAPRTKFDGRPVLRICPARSATRAGERHGAGPARTPWLTFAIARPARRGVRRRARLRHRTDPRLARAGRAHPARTRRPAICGDRRGRRMVPDVSRPAHAYRARPSPDQRHRAVRRRTHPRAGHRRDAGSRRCSSSAGSPARSCR